MKSRRKRKSAAVTHSVVKPKGPKLEHHTELMKDNELRGHLPETMKLDKESLFFMLSLYPSVYVKPNQGAFGEGVMKVTKSSESSETEQFHVHRGTKQHTFHSKERLYSFILSKKTSKKYIVQQGIDLLHWEDRPFDLRIMVKKQEDESWKNEGILGRVAQSNKIVTNIRSGGSPVSIEKLLSSHTNWVSLRNVKEQIDRIGVRASEKIESKYPGVKLLGIDIGLDQRLKPWIIEVNMKPEKICWDCIEKLYQENESVS
ncbi:YheC/YheD family protein [Paenibacillus alvei]|uniref:Uncharacterized protein n=1 Tax=Paenibacillus alvei TaxID=44250 RepID=A0AAP7DKS5_PAEAL|nr:YheC/YheD family protein [Paenibacillus alvei]NOJ73315.1 hypothetical protein [Paenibacillus alvei]